MYSMLVKGPQVAIGLSVEALDGGCESLLHWCDAKVTDPQVPGDIYQRNHGCGMCVNKDLQRKLKRHKIHENLLEFRNDFVTPVEWSGIG